MKSSKKSLKAAVVLVLALILLTNAVLPMAVVGSDNDVSADYQYYSVKTGDTLTRIAKNYGVTVSDLMTANDLSNADKIYTGQIIKVPLSSASVKGNSMVSSRISMTVVAECRVLYHYGRQRHGYGYGDAGGDERAQSD